MGGEAAFECLALLGVRRRDLVAMAVVDGCFRFDNWAGDEARWASDEALEIAAQRNEQAAAAAAAARRRRARDGWPRDSSSSSSASSRSSSSSSLASLSSSSSSSLSSSSSAAAAAATVDRFSVVQQCLGVGSSRNPFSEFAFICRRQLSSPAEVAAAPAPSGGHGGGGSGVGSGSALRAVGLAGFPGLKTHVDGSSGTLKLKLLRAVCTNRGGGDAAAREAYALLDRMATTQPL
jgi:hypothetical protein